MKKSIISCCVTGILGLFCAQQCLAQVGQTPEVVKEAFQVKYPNATNVTYTDKLVEVDINFVDSGYSCKARYSIKGAWDRTLKGIKSDALPPSVQDGFSKSKYSADWKLDSVYEVDNPDNLTEYELVVEKSDIEHKNLYFSVKGRLLSDNLSF